MTNTLAFNVALMGARMHYAVPRLFHQHGALARFYADICATQGWPRALRLLPSRCLPAAVQRLAGRVPQGIPPRLVLAFTRFGLEYQRRRSQARSISEMTAAHLWAGATFGQLVLEAEPAQSTDLYCFNSASLELLRAWRGRGRLSMVEQTIAPRRIEEQIVSQEHLTFPGWQEPLPQDANVEAYMEREEEEWRHADVIVCGSEFVRQGVHACGGPRERCVVVPYGIDLHGCFAGQRAELAGRPLRVLTVGEVGLRKGTPYVLEAARQLAGRVQVRMAGPMALLPERADELRRHVEWVGIVPRREIAAHYLWADVFLLPSLCEGSATVTYEALGAGLPVIATASTGSIIEPNVSGFCVAEGDASEIVSVLEKFLEDPQLLKVMSVEARRRAKQGGLTAYGERLMSTARAAQANLLGVPKDRTTVVESGKFRRA